MADTEFQKVDLGIFIQVSAAMECCRENGFYDETIAQSVDELTDDLLEKDADLATTDRKKLRDAVLTYKHAAMNRRHTSMTIAAVEGDEIVIRIPVTALPYQSEPRGFFITDAAAFAPHVAREIGGEDMAERLWIEPLVEAAIIRAAECDAPGIKWDDASADDQALYEAENDQS